MTTQELAVLFQCMADAAIAHGGNLRDVLLRDVADRPLSEADRVVLRVAVDVYAPERREVPA